MTFLLFNNISVFSYNCQSIRNEVIRLHIPANSDSDEDQKLKLKVRDRILAEYSEIFDNTDDSESAKAELEKNLGKIKDTVTETITENGFEYDIEVSISEEYFTTRKYDGITMPSGKYTALKIVIGEGKGKNWWCVLFPAICLPAAEGNKTTDVFNESQSDIMQNTTKYEVKFKIFEYIEELKNKISEYT